MDRSGGVDFSPHCQRCGSTNTKFCYYNNYSLTQPRYFCKECRRYWTKGGSLRNVPVGGGCRKSRRGRAITISRHQHHHNHKCPLSCAGVEISDSSSSNIDLAVVYANFLKQDTKHETEHVANLVKDDSRTIEIGGVVDAMSFELPTPNVEVNMFSQAGDWYIDSQLVGLNEVSLTGISPEKFTGEIHEIGHLIDNWSSFDFSI